MGGIRRGIVVFQVTGNTFRTHRVEPQPGTRLVALVAIHARMSAIQRKSGLTVDFRNVAYHPGSRIVTPIAILTHRPLMHILVTRSTIRFGIREYQGRMASPAGHLLMLSGKFERG